MRTVKRCHFAAAIYWLFVIGLQVTSGCSRPNLFIGVGGKYNEASMELIRGRRADVDKAILNLETIVQENPTYRDSLTLLGKAYYKKGRYQDAHLVLQRALAVNKEDEIAWLVFGLAQIRVGDGRNGLESIKGGLTLLGKAMKDDYRGFSGWDQNATVRSSLRRSVLQAMKGLDETENLIRSTELLLARIDDEEWSQRRGKSIERVTEAGQ